MSSSAVVPIVLWGRTPPTHCISVITCTNDQKTVCTGSNDGQLILWDFDGIILIPRLWLLGHSAAISCLSKSPDSTSIYSSSENGEICLWDISDGRCILFTTIGNSSHTGLHPFITVVSGQIGGKHLRLLAYGLYAVIHVIDGVSLQPLYQLASRLSPDWINCLTIFRPLNRQDEVVIAVTSSGAFKLWNLSVVQSTIVYEDCSKQLRCLNAQTIICCLFNHCVLLVVCNKYWHIYDTTSFMLLCSVSHIQGQRWAGGDFLSSDRVVVWSNEGIAYIYDLPQSCNPESEHFRKDTSKRPTANKTAVLHSTLCGVGDATFMPCCPVFTFLYGRRSPYSHYILRGDLEGNISIWDLSKLNGLVNESGDSRCDPTFVTSLSKLWENTYPKPAGIIDQLSLRHVGHTSEDQIIAVTSSIYLPVHGRLVCGREDGSIVIVPATQTASVQLLQGKYAKRVGWPPHKILRGHINKVTSLLYPHQESSRYKKSWLVSGGMDFSVLLWDLFDGDLIFKFNVHGGEITQLIAPPDTVAAKVQPCVCSVASDHSVALLSLSEHKVVMLAGAHLYPVKTIKWRPVDDFMMVHTTDSSVYIWQMETGHLDRVVQGNVADAILTACDEALTPSDDLLSLKTHLAAALKRRNLNALKGAAFRHIKKDLEDDNKDTSGEELSTYALTIQPLRANPKDSDIHLLLFDTEALIVKLLSDVDLQSEADRSPSITTKFDHLKDEALKKITSSSPKLTDKITSFMKKNIKTVKQQVLENLSDSENDSESSSSSHSQSRQCLSLMDRHLVLDIAQLLLSCLYAWGLDQELDVVCLQKLGLLWPHTPVSFGLVSKGGFTSLMLPGWHNTAQNVEQYGANVYNDKGVSREEGSSSVRRTHSPMAKPRCTLTRAKTIDVSSSSIRPPTLLMHSAHWQMSSSLSTQHLLSIISLANTLMGMSNSSFINPTEKKLKRMSSQGKQVSPVDSNDPIDLAEIKQGWSKLAVFHCIILPDKLGNGLFKPPQLEELARRWQDRCLEVREAAQALLLAELRRIGSCGRKRLLEDWAPFLPSYVDNPTTLAPSLTESMSSVSFRSVLSTEEDVEDLISSNIEFSNKASYEVRRKNATAIVMLGVIGSEFGSEIEPGHKETFPREIAEGFDVTANNHLARHTCKALSFLLLEPPSQRLPLHTPIRRAAVDLLGRGFSVWQPYMNVSAVLLGLLGLCCEADKAADTAGLPVSPNVDSRRTARHSLKLIAGAKPTTFITCLSKEVARHQAMVNQSGHMQTSLFTNSVLVKVKPEILRIVEMLIEKMLPEIVSLVTEVMDIIVHCIDPSQMKNESLMDVFPPVARFPMVSYCMQSKRIAAGSTSGKIVIYELKAMRSTSFVAHKHPASALAFSPDGKYLASLSTRESKIHIWQSGTSLFGMLHTSIFKHSCTFTTTEFDEIPQYFRLIWTSGRSVHLLMKSGKEFRYLI